MALIKCKECGKEISDKASVCPNCGIRVHHIKRLVVLSCSIILVLLMVWGFLINDGVSNTMDKLQLQQADKELKGTWEIIGDSTNFKENLISQLTNKYENMVQIEDISLYNTLNIQTITPFGSGSNMGAQYNDEEDFIVAIIGDKDGVPIVACFELEDNYLVQIECDINGDELILSKNINLRYKKKTSI